MKLKKKKKEEDQSNTANDHFFSFPLWFLCFFKQKFSHSSYTYSCLTYRNIKMQNEENRKMKKLLWRKMKIFLKNTFNFFLLCEIISIDDSSVYNFSWSWYLNQFLTYLSCDFVWSCPFLMAFYIVFSTLTSACTFLWTLLGKNPIYLWR